MPRAVFIIGPELERQLADNGFGDFVLDRENVLELAIVAIRPQMAADHAVDQLRGNAYPVAGLGTLPSRT